MFSVLCRGLVNSLPLDKLEGSKKQARITVLLNVS